MSRAMISLEKITNWDKEKLKKAKKYVWNIDEAQRRIFNDIPLYDGEIVEEKTKRG